MARYRGRRNYPHRMTPARRAALRKAQLASARKRKAKLYAKRAAVGAGVFAGLVVTNRVNMYARNLNQVGKDARFVKGKIKKYRSRKAVKSHGLTIQSGPWV